ncbi:MAG TPA: UvrD-helicase domain-containing protein, partial [Anaerolineae bacterium]
AAWLVTHRDVKPGQILCVTFTNKAAEEMRGRLEGLLGEPARDLRLHTFHGLCARILRQYGAAIDLNPRFVIVDEEDQTRIIGEIVRNAGLSREQFPPYRVIDFISEFKRDLKDPAQAAPSERLEPEFIQIAEEYGATLRAGGLVDFDDLIGLATRLLAKDREVRLALQNALPHVLVDEYQDINRAQFELLRLLAPRGSDVLAVADDAQSIYGWRGAAPELIGAFEGHYHPRVIELEESYRSTETILYAAQNMIRHGDGPDRRRSLLKTVRPAGSPIYHYLFATGHQEQSWLIRLIHRLVEEQGVAYGDIAILYRTHQLADEIEGALLQANIPVQRIRKESFFEEPLAREVVRYLHLVRSLTGDDLLAAFNFPQTLADELTVLQLQTLADVHHLSLADLARRGEDFPELSPLTRANLAAFMRLFDELLVPRADQGAAAVVAALFDVLARRRSPFTPDEFRSLRDAGAFVRFADAAAALRDYLAIYGEATLVAPATADGACAAAILGDAVTRYLGGTLRVEMQPPVGDKTPSGHPDPTDAAETATASKGDALTIRLAPETAPLVLRPPRGGTLGYSLSTLAWRLSQDLLIAHETLAAAPVVVYDLETTGTDVRRDEIVEIGAQRLEEGQAQGAPFYSLVRPVQAIPREATRVHHIRNEDVQAADPIAAVLPRFLRYVGSHTVVGHNIIRFDNRIIDRETGRLYRRGFPNRAIDTLDMARRLYAEPEGTESYALEALLLRFGLGNRVEHRVGPDVNQIATLFEHLLAENSLQLGLRALPEYLPLVAVGLAAAGVTRADENRALWQAGRRMLDRLGEIPGLEQAAGLLAGTPTGQADLSAAADALRASPAPSAEDRGWLEFRDRFLDQIATFDRFANDHSLNAFLDYQALVTGLDTGRSQPAKVSLLTLHNAKGTEFPVVIIAGVEEENLPLWTTIGDPRQLAEERRVFYVGLTRAQQRLYLTSVRQRGGGGVRMPSRFAFELPSRYVRRIVIGPRGSLRELKG